MKKHVLTLCLSLACASAWAAPILDPSSGHYYDVIPASGITWDDARSGALGNFYLGLQGHLATVTSSCEDGYVGAAVAAAGSGEFWLGGFQNPITETTAAAGWTWVNGEGTFPGVNGALGFANPYSNWNSGEPNDYYGAGTEQYLGINLGVVGGFNDEGNLGLIGGYVIEYDPNTIPDHVPDAGATASLLGGALAMLASFARRIRK
ncbi:MAG: VPDSG-CTERM sorting domain-containing protein [Verrucomicrobia bacterium]|nr:VPDSG-CTERM sorting domain-containing protein [Verrucomicrobiota bacterium]